MKPSRSFLVWFALAVCAVLVIGAMTWLTRGVLAAERDRVTAEQERNAAESRADLEERTRLALWRMDALGASIMLRENRLPDGYYKGMLPTITPALDPAVLLHFEIQKGGEPTSSSTPQGAGALEDRLKRLRTLLANNPLPGDEWAQINRAVEEGEIAWKQVPKEAVVEQNSNAYQRLNYPNDQLRNDGNYQNSSNVAERAQRAKAIKNQVENNSIAGPSVTTDVGQMRGIWLGGELFLLRKVVRSIPSISGESDILTQNFIQGVWLDSRELRDKLLKEVKDLLPNARLEPVAGERAAVDPLAMVSFPFQLERNEWITVSNTFDNSPFGVPLWVAWSAVALAFLTSSLLVRSVMRLSERRASFVSAVTHELRTPLTTFRLYSDMLESGAVKEEKRGSYLRVLSREADRLSHLVENVLAFSRIERGNARSNVRSVKTCDLLEPMRERFEARLATAGMTLVMDATCARTLRVDTAAVEHILFNLIDNAAKYAASGAPPQVNISVRETARHVEILVSDHGPGIPPAERGRIFQAFHKSAREAAESQPGVGLGLALSRRLARAQGGELQCMNTGTGGCFVLRLPAPG